jgi:periplasmic protein TonB
MLRLAPVLAFLTLSLSSIAALAEDPRPITRVEPEYPFAAYNRGVRGSVLVEYEVDRRGRVVSPRILEAQPPGVFDAAVLRALSRWRYESAGAEPQTMKVKMTFKP